MALEELSFHIRLVACLHVCLLLELLSATLISVGGAASGTATVTTTRFLVTGRSTVRSWTSAATATFITITTVVIATGAAASTIETVTTFIAVVSTTTIETVTITTTYATTATFPGVMANFAALETFTALGAVGIAGGTTLALGAFDGYVQSQKFGAVQVLDGIGSVSFVLELDESES